MSALVITAKASREGAVSVWGGSWGDVSRGPLHRSRILGATLFLVRCVYRYWPRVPDFSVELPVGVPGLCVAFTIRFFS